MDMTACFLPKPVTGVNGNGMHTNMSLAREGQEPLLRQEGPGRPVEAGLGLHRPHPRQRQRHLPGAQLRASTPTAGSTRTSRRPNQIKASAIDRGSMVRIPLGNEKSARIEVRSIAPDANPYLAIYTHPAHRPRRPAAPRRTTSKRPRTRFLPDNIYDAHPPLQGAATSRAELLGEDVHGKYAELKLASGRALPEGAGHAGQDRARSSSTTRSPTSTSGTSSEPPPADVGAAGPVTRERNTQNGAARLRVPLESPVGVSRLCVLSLCPLCAEPVLGGQGCRTRSRCRRRRSRR